MYWSAELVALVPPGVVTVTSTVPTEAGGELAVIVVELVTVKVAAWLPNSTALAPNRLLPVMLTVVPPMVKPPVGVTAVTVGGGGSIRSTGPRCW